MAKSRTETLTIDFEEVTYIFLKLKPIVAKVSNIRGLIAVVNPVVSEIVARHYNPPKGKSYKQEDLRSLMNHLVDCVNSIMPDKIPYRALIDSRNQWFFKLIDKNDPKPPRPN